MQIKRDVIDLTLVSMETLSDQIKLINTFSSLYKYKLFT